ncbi:MAG TPA: TonB-dependent receptor plug domain-containing protein [Gemmatimonadales bacterium]
MKPRTRVLIPLVLLMALSVHLAAQDTASAVSTDPSKAKELAPITVVGRVDNLIGIAASASQGHVGAVDLRLRPLLREGELLETVPGVIVTQHSGDGKANQYFVRGFNLDHGTDFQTKLEGMPVNMPSHAHGQGYTDLNFLIPELVDYLDYRLGVYHADMGDFGSAGGAEVHLVKKLAQPFGTVSAGENGLARVALGGSRRIGSGDLLIGGEAKGYNGPWEVSEELRKFSGLARYSWERGNSQFSVLGMAYHNQWDASDQIPDRAVASGLISRFGQIDPTDGGNTQRYSLSGSWRHLGASSVQDVQLFGIYSDLSLFSNFAYFLDDPVNGDQFNQREHRVVLGGSASHTQPGQSLGVSHIFKMGLQTRADFVDGLGLYHTQARNRIGTVRQDDVTEWGTGVWLQAESRWRDWFRSVLGVRGDLYTFNVSGDRPENAGHRTAGIVSPKASLIFAPSATTEFYVSGGFGFHSNDARGTTITTDPVTGGPASQVDPLVRSRGAELGIRVSPVQNWRSTVSLWLLNLDSELLFIGDGGATEPSAASRRRGITWANFYRATPQLSLDADVSFSHARFSGAPSGEDHIPGALESVVAAGITWAPKASGPFGSIRVRHFGSYPLIEDNSVQATPTTLVNAEAGFLLRGIRIQASVLNLFDTEASDIQYYYTSRLQGEPASGVDDVHFHPVEPRAVRVSIGWGL